MEISEFEKKRASNLIWNSAHDYTIETGFRVYDEEGRADVYWNSIVGAIHLHYNWDQLMAFYNTFHERINQAVYESLFWIALENAAYLKEKDNRPVFPYLRREYAKKKLDSLHGQIALEDSAGQRLIAITMGHFRRALGGDCELPDKVDVDLLNAIELPADLDTEGVIDAISKALSTYFTYTPGGEKEKKSPLDAVNPFHLFLFGRKKKNGEAYSRMGPVRHMSFGYGEHVLEYGSEVLDQSHLSVAFAAYTAQSDEGLKEYITNYFGKSLYDEKKVRDLQKKYCYGNHQDVRLHFTRGSYTDEMLDSGYAGKMHREALRQKERNEKAFQENEAVHRLQIERLTSRIRNSLLSHLDDQVVKSQTGKLAVRRIWRGLYLNDDRIFDKTLRGDTGNLAVDILLDASTSELHRQELVSAQGYMIAQALTNCGIPVRVSSFCSMNGYTIWNLFRDYNEPDKNREIFRYFSAGANRDGLAIRLEGAFLKDVHADHRILIVLSDCKPNDVIKVRTSTGQYADYAAKIGVEDTAAEVHALRMQGITVLCVFTGEDDALSNVHRIYEQDFTRIHQLDFFADAVGNLLQQRIRLM